MYMVDILEELDQGGKEQLNQGGGGLLFDPHVSVACGEGVPGDVEFLSGFRQ